MEELAHDGHYDIEEIVKQGEFCNVFKIMLDTDPKYAGFYEGYIYGILDEVGIKAYITTYNYKEQVQNVE